MTDYSDNPYTPQMELLCKAMPALRPVPGAVPWNPILLAEQWRTSPAPERALISFVLSVWDSSTNYLNWVRRWGVEPFTLGDFARLDEPNQKAVAAWFAAPFWP